jgi:hypothetical protein
LKVWLTFPCYEDPIPLLDACELSPEMLYINNVARIYALQNSIFPCIFPQNREFDPGFGSESAPPQFVVGAAVASHPAGQFLVRIGAARDVDLGHIGWVFGELDDEPVG